MKTLLKSTILLACLAFSAFAGTTPDPTQGGLLPKFNVQLAPSGAPDYVHPYGYLDHSCGNWSPVPYRTVTDEQTGTTTVSFKFLTSCSTGGRGTLPKRFESCWDVTFISGVVLDRQLLLYATWKQGQTPIGCP